ncbi:MAG TPA: hypothetical protein VHE30_25940 [Polyangiaceae bacterium]|nr:hypothetical protein [Polyangiaceae bacterium]
MSAALFEKSHGKLRAIAQRPSDQSPIDTDALPRRDRHPNGWFKAGNQAAKGSRGKALNVKHLRAARRRLQEARSRGETPSRSDVVLDAALTRYESARRELGTESLLVLTPVSVWAENTERARDLGELADAAGVATPEGERLLARRDALEGRATRALTAALAAAAALGPRRDANGNPLHAAILGAGKGRTE